ncbi:hypothetical protein LLG88_13440 [bacterium]|nr:hypothetical protein [bacterium]
MSQVDGPLQKLKVTHFCQDWPSGLVDAEQLAGALGISASRITELADAGYWPHFRCEGGAPRFRMKESKQWAARNLLQQVEGKTLPVECHVIALDARITTDPPVAIAALLNLIEVPAVYLPPGVYFLCSGQEVVYVGQSVSVVSRVVTHRAGGKRFDRAYFIPIPESELDTVEAFFIKHLNPALNGNGGRNRDLTVAAERELSDRYLGSPAPA